MTDLRKAAEMVCELWFNQGGITAATFKPYMEVLRQVLAQPEQEPVAWREVAGRTTKYYDYNEDGKGEPLYTKPPKWQRLTDDEIKEVYVKRGVTLTFNDFARAIEAKLKEKNCG